MTYKHITGTGDTVVQKSTTNLKQIVVNQTGDPDWTVTVYNGVDNTGDVVAILDANNGGNYSYDTILSKGLFIHTAFTGTGTISGDITVIYG